jgi:hypothetical protein
MAIIIEEPDRNNATPDEWRCMGQDLEAFTGGLLLVGVENIDTSGEPKILAGSRFEVNGRKYICPINNGNESISGSASNNVTNYIYAIPSGSGDQSTLLFQYSTTTPTWNAAKGGWYSGNNRAIAKLFYSSNGPVYGGKVILDSFNAMMFINTKQDVPVTGGWMASQGGVNQETIVTLPSGLYRYELKGGTGGSGGNGGKVDGGTATGGAGAEGEIKTGEFKVGIAATCLLSTGGNGADGGNGGDVSSGITAGGGGGGGGSSGGGSYIVFNDFLVFALGGSGGGGGGGDTDYDLNTAGSGGGGGGGGYGSGEKGHDSSKIASGGGGGGNGGTAGNGGKGGLGVGTGGYGGGGSGYLSGAAAGGSYGIYGGNGGGSGGSGGASKKKALDPSSTDTEIQAPIRKFYNAYQGGGGGGGGGGSGGNGGGGLKSTSSGYARIYRVG